MWSPMNFYLFRISIKELFFWKIDSINHIGWYPIILNLLFNITGGCQYALRSKGEIFLENYCPKCQRRESSPWKSCEWKDLARLSRILVSCFHVVNSNNIKTPQLCHLSQKIYGDAFISFLHPTLLLDFSIQGWHSQYNKKTSEKYFFGILVKSSDTNAMKLEWRWKKKYVCTFASQMKCLQCVLDQFQ